MKVFLNLFFVALASMTFAQRTIPPTDQFAIEGAVVQSKVITLGHLDTMQQMDIRDQVIYNQEGEIKDTLTQLRGIQLKDILAEVELVYGKPKELNEFYFVLMASDGYKVVYSWNEIYNTSIGDEVYILTEKDGKRIRDMPERVICISTADLKSGRRFVKGLERIEIKRIE